MRMFENGDLNDISENPAPNSEETSRPEETPNTENPNTEEKPDYSGTASPSGSDDKAEIPVGGSEVAGENAQTAMSREPRMEQKPPKKRKSEVRMTRGGLAMLLVLCLMVAVLAGAGIGTVFNGFGETNPSVETTSEGNNGTENAITPIPGENTSNGKTETAPGAETLPRENPEYSVLAKVANECIQSVVIINVTESATAYGQEYTTSGAGSGVIYTTDGYIVTNYHVVGAATKTISVVLYDGSVYEGKFIYGDEYADVSVIKIEKNDCTPAKIGDSTQMVLGDTVIAIGNPLGYGLTVTDGIVSALARDVTVENTTMTLMQTSAAINSGNSGGGLFNVNGELIGIVNAKIGGTSVEGMGFAIPSSTVVKCINDLKDYGYITGKARLGVTVKTQQYQTWPYMQTYSYIQVTDINANGSAAKSGLKTGDILQKINGTEITSFATLSQMLTKYSVGDTVTLTVRRPTIELTNNNLQEYLNSCEEIEVKITFVEFNPNA